MPRRKRGRFIVLEGPDLSGKSTQALRLVASLKRAGRRVVHTREPGGTKLAEEVRTLLLDVRHKVVPLAELFLYEAARAQHTQEKLLPALQSGATVVSERYTMATLAYQGYGRKLPHALIKVLNRIATGGVRPDLTVVVDGAPAALKKRRRAKKDRLESESDAFARRVRRGYRLLARGPKVARVDGSKSRDEVAAAIWARVRRMP